MADKETLQEKIKQSMETAEKFSNIYYKKVDQERHAIDKLYLDTATMTWNGNCIEGNALFQYLNPLKRVTINILTKNHRVLKKKNFNYRFSFLFCEFTNYRFSFLFC